VIETTHVYDPSGELVKVEEREVPDPEPEPLTDTEKLATLLAAKSMLTVDEAADLTGRDKADLTAEAEAWAVAEAIAKP
jgi:hypothetical protein